MGRARISITYDLLGALLLLPADCRILSANDSTEYIDTFSIVIEHDTLPAAKTGHQMRALSVAYKAELIDGPRYEPTYAGWSFGSGADAYNEIDWLAKWRIASNAEELGTKPKED